MPYIKQADRDRLALDIQECSNQIGCVIRNPGELNYVITKILIDYVGKPSYSKINEVVGVLECCKLELYRKLAAGYEDQKALENGDVY